MDLGAGDWAILGTSPNPFLPRFWSSRQTSTVARSCPRKAKADAVEVTEGVLTTARTISPALLKVP